MVGLQPALAVRRLSSATTPGVERDAPKYAARWSGGDNSHRTFPAHGECERRRGRSPPPRGEGSGVGGPAREMDVATSSPSPASSPHP